MTPFPTLSVRILVCTTGYSVPKVPWVHGLPPTTFHLQPITQSLPPTTFNYHLQPTTGRVGPVSGIIFYNSSFWSPIVRAHHLLSSLAQCSAWNSVLNGVRSKDFKVSRHQNFEVLGFLGLAAYKNLEVLGFQGLPANHNFDVLGFQSPTTKRTCKVQDPSRSQTLYSANPGSRIFLGPWHKSAWHHRVPLVKPDRSICFLSLKGRF